MSIMRSLKIPDALYRDIIKYFDYINETPDAQFDMAKFYSMISLPLKQQIVFYIHKELINHIDFLQTCSSVEISFLVNHLKTVLYLPRDTVVRQGE